MSDFELRFASPRARAPALLHGGLGSTDGTILQSARQVAQRARRWPGHDGLGGAITKSDNKGTYFASCLLPITVQLISVYHSENDGVSGN